MDETGIMQTGWTDIGKKRYYFDMDGILQTGTVIIDKKTYELDTDGSLKDYTPKKKSSKKKSSGKSDTSDKSGTSTAKKSVALTFDDGPSSFTEDVYKRQAIYKEFQHRIDSVKDGDGYTDDCFSSLPLSYCCATCSITNSTSILFLSLCAV